MIPRPGRVLRPLHRLRPEPQGDGYALRGGRRLPCGWVLIDLELQCEKAPRLLVDSGQGFALSTSIALPFPVGGRLHALLRLPERVDGLTLSCEGECKLGAVQVREIGAAEAFARVAAPVIERRLKDPRELLRAGVKLVKALASGGPRAVMDRLLQKTQHDAPQLRYAEWRRRYDTEPGPLTPLTRQPLISIVMPVYETPERWLRAAIQSVRAQRYPHWELCIADDASKSPHVRAVLQEAARSDARIKVVYRPVNGHIAAASNSALALATGEYVALLDHDDALAAQALELVAAEAVAHPGADLIYSDEDKLDERGTHYDPFFKPDWNRDLFYSENYLAHLCAMRASRVREAGGFREGFEGSQDYDLYLRVIGSEDKVRHIPRVLYHWRAIEGSTARATAAKSYATDAGLRALQEHLPSARVEPGPLPTTYRVRWPSPAPAPLVSLIIPTRDGRALLEPCIESLIAQTTYRQYELIVVDNQSSAPDALAYLASLERRGVARVLRHDQPFNFSAINNAAVAQARGALVGLLNNDLEFIEPDWLAELVSHAVRPDIGVVGARLLYPDRTLQHGGVILGIGGFAGHAHKYFPAAAPGYFARAQLTQNLSAVTAACLLVRRETYLAVGGLDESLAVALNDVDFCLRVRQTGLRNLWTPFATLLHHESKSRGAEDTHQKRARFRAEAAKLKARWGDALLNDPAYNPNLTLDAENFTLAWPPRGFKA
jgi:GT2 family glycosyltransferase